MEGKAQVVDTAIGQGTLCSGQESKVLDDLPTRTPEAVKEI